MSAEDFDGVETMPSGESSGYRRRLTSDTLTNLRRRRTGPGRALIQPPRRSAAPGSRDDDDDDDDDDSSDGDSDDSDGDDISCFDIICCCWGPRCCVAVCMLTMSFGTWSAAITYGILRQPSYEQIVTPIRMARQRWLGKTPHTTEEGFSLFDRNADGRISVADMAIVARITTGENPTHEDLVKYIAKGDLDGDGELDEQEYVQLVHRERASRPRGERVQPTRGEGHGHEGNP